MRAQSHITRFYKALLLVATLLCIPACSKSSEEDVIESQIDMLESIEIVQLPNKTVYGLDEPFDIEGLKVIGHFKNETKHPISITTNHILGFDSSTPNSALIVTINYSGKQISFNLEVLALAIKDGVLIKCSETKEVFSIPNTVRIIGKKAFYSSSVKKVVVPNSVEIIEEEAFFNSKLEEINFPNSLKEIGKEAFYYCRNLKEIDLSQTQLTKIKESTFFRNDSVTKLGLPTTLTTIEAQAFLCSKNLTELIIPEYVTSIAIEAFRESGIVNLKLPNGLSEIEERAFYICPNLESVEVYGPIPTEITNSGKLGHYSFEQALNLVKFELPRGIKHIGQRIIGGNTKLKEFTVHEDIASIHFAAFGYRGGIEHVLVKAQEPPKAINADLAWYGFPDNVKIIEVPSEAVIQYKSAKGWKEFTNQIKATQ